MKYRIKAHPTMYNGVQYRSRLEARWAAFFDLIGWKHEYEPIDLQGWSPDFILHGKKRSTLVEVKPVYEIPDDVTEKIDLAVPDENQEVLILGVAPFFCDNIEHHCVGWLREEEGCWDKAPFTLHSALGFCHETQSFRCRITELYDGGYWGSSSDITKQVEAAWRKAGNTVQWRPR